MNYYAMNLNRKRTPKSCVHTQRCALEDWMNQLITFLKKSRFSFRKEQRAGALIRNAEALRCPVASGGSRALTSGTWCCLQRAEGRSQTCCRNLNGRLTWCSRLARRLFVCCNSRAFPSHCPLSNRIARLVCASAESASFREITQSRR